jgi:hypothetical protein
MSGPPPRSFYGSADGPGIQTVIVGGMASGDGSVIPMGSAASADHSGTIASGGTAQQVAPSNAARRGVFLQNIGEEDLWFSFVGPAAIGIPGSYLLPAAAVFSATSGVVPSGALSVIGATTGQPFSAMEL